MWTLERGDFGVMKPPSHILLVDDDRQVGRYLKKALEENGYHVTATTSAKQALAIIKEHMPDLLILDLQIPEPDGFYLLKAERSKFPYLRILVISGYLHGALLEAAKIFGAIATLEKPVTAEALVGKVREVLGR
jgi:DNA-binding NtrC family response regulator